MSLGKERRKNGSQGKSQQPPQLCAHQPSAAMVMFACDINMYPILGAVFSAMAKLYAILYILGSHVKLVCHLRGYQLLSITQQVIISASTLEAIKGVWTWTLI